MCVWVIRGLQPEVEAERVVEERHEAERDPADGWPHPFDRYRTHLLGLRL